MQGDDDGTHNLPVLEGVFLSQMVVAKAFQLHATQLWVLACIMHCKELL